jgi:tRNA 2-thiouridine synthesizing protein A
MPLYEVSMYIDARGGTPPSPTASAEQALRALEPGEIIEVLTSDPGSVPEFRAWAIRTGNELLESRGDCGRYCFVIRHPTRMAVG